jgi:hypothetical protein
MTRPPERIFLGENFPERRHCYPDRSAPALHAAPNSDRSLQPRSPGDLTGFPGGRFHTLVVATLSITWILDGLEVTLVGSISGALKQSPVLQFTNGDVGLASSSYCSIESLGRDHWEPSTSVIESGLYFAQERL